MKWHTDKCGSHSYTPYYYELLKDRVVRTLLEVGIGYPDLMRGIAGGDYQTGASLHMWKEFFPEAMIYGCDIEPQCMMDEDRIRTFVVDETKPEELDRMMAAIGEPLDVIIDDGSHITEHQIATARHLLPYVKQGGVYVVEDVQCPDDVLRGVGRGEKMQFGKQCDDCLIVIRR